jgi:F-type H+-transporting ATPase subunit epsilon
VNGFVLHLEAATQYERVDDVLSFVAEDASGSFGILPGHARFVTVLEFGLASFRTASAGWRYVAAPGAVLRFAGGELHLATRRFVCGADYERIRDVLRQQLRAEEDALREIRLSLRRLEESMLRRLWQLARGEGRAA